MFVLVYWREMTTCVRTPVRRHRVASRRLAVDVSTSLLERDDHLCPYPCSQTSCGV